MADSQHHWRLLHTPPMSGPDNMALDEAILESVASGRSLPTVRLYSWDPPCLSVGYAQPIDQVDQPALRQRGWGLVRRPTGGRAILHADELTYAVTAAEADGAFGGGVLPSYRRLSQALALGLARLGLSIHTEPETPVRPAGQDEPVCFQVPAAHELTVRGKKLLGSAQLRRRGAALQHGSLPLRGDLGRICQVLRYANSTRRAAARQALLARAATAEELLGRPVAWETAAEAVAEGFREALNLDLTQQDLNPNERRRADQLRRERYTNRAWTERL